MTKNRFRLDPLGARFRIWNAYSGRYLCTSQDKIRIFPTRGAALAYMNRVGLNKDIYYTEAVIE